MKKLLLILLIGLNFGAKAQLGWQTAQTIDSLNNLWIYTVTCTGCWTHTHQGALGDSIAQALDALHSSIGGASGLTAVLRASNTDSANDIVALNASNQITMDLGPNESAGVGGFSFGNPSGAKVYMSAGNVEIFNGSTFLGGLMYGGSFSQLTLVNSGYNMNFYSNTLTAARNIVWSNQAGIPMLQTTNLASVVNNAGGYTTNDGSGNTSIVTGSNISTRDASGNGIVIGTAGGSEYIAMGNSLGGTANVYYGNVGINNYWMPDRNGASDTVALKSDLTASSFPQPYFDFHNTSMVWDTVNKFTINGSGGNIVKIDSAATPTTNLDINPTIGTYIGLPDKGLFYKTAFSGGTSTVTMQMGATANGIAGQRTSSIDIISLTLGGSQAILQIDSNTSSVNVGHLGGAGAIPPTIAGGAGAGTGPTLSIAGDDLGGYISVTTGTLPAISSVVVTVTFNVAFKSAPKCITLTPANSNAAVISGAGLVWIDQSGITTTTFTLNVGSTALIAATTYQWYYFIKQ